jgi:hypothetical protein
MWVGHCTLVASMKETEPQNIAISIITCMLCSGIRLHMPPTYVLHPMSRERPNYHGRRTAAADSEDSPVLAPDAADAVADAAAAPATPPATLQPVGIKRRTQPATLDSGCPWRLFLSLRALESSDGAATTDIAVVVRFVEEPGFEPPGVSVPACWVRQVRLPTSERRRCGVHVCMCMCAIISACVKCMWGQASTAAAMSPCLHVRCAISAHVTCVYDKASTAAAVLCVHMCARIGRVAWRCLKRTAL